MAFRQPEYEELVRKLAEANSRMARLLESHIKLSTVRRRRSQSKVFSALQSVIKRAYHALRCSFSCTCPNRHGVNFQLLTPHLIPYVDIETLIQGLELKISLNYDPDDVKGKGIHSGWIWEELSLRIEEPSLQSSHKVRLPTATEKGSRRLMVAVSNTPQKSQGTVKPVDLVNLCRVLAQKGHKPTECCGYIVDPASKHQHRFAVYTLGSCNNTDGWSMVSLCELLDKGVFKDRKEGPQLPQQLLLAATVASSILQLHGTPWMPTILTNKSIYFMQRNGTFNYDNVYVARKLPDVANTGPQELSEFESRAIKNPTIFAIGILLIELILCESLENLHSSKSYDKGRPPAHPLLRPALVEDILYQVECASTDQYREAVKNCLRCNFTAHSHLDEERFREEVYTHIVAPLQDSVQAYQSLEPPNLSNQ